MSLSKILERFKLNTYDLLPLFLYGTSIYLVFQQIYEVLYIYKNYICKHSYNPYLYTLYVLIPVAAFLTVLSSSLIKTPNSKRKFMTLSFYCELFIIFGMLTLLSNEYIWRLIHFIQPKIMNVPVDMLYSAIRVTTFYLPLIVSFGFLSFYNNFITDKVVESLLPAFSLNLYSPDVEESGPLTCEVTICIDVKTNKPVVTPELKRMEGTLIQGATGTGKTSTLLLPMACSDLEKKYFFRELGKELGYRALEKGYAYVDAPLSNEELNRNFSLKWLKPIKGKEALFENEIKDMIRYKDPVTGELIFRDVGVIAVDPDGEYVRTLRTVAKNFGIDCIIIDPLDENSVGINPFIGKDPAKIASIISNVLKGMYESENPSETNLFFAQVTQQAIENLSILLKVMYPRLHGGLLPTLEDMLEMLHNYNLVEEMCEEMKKDPILAQEYKILITYFEKHFYNPPLNERGIPISSTIGSARKQTEQFLYGASTQLDNLLRHRGVKRLLCSRSNNIDFDDILANGKCLTVCTRRGPLGTLLSKAFGMFFILTLQDAVLRRPGNEKTRIPSFLYIDEFPDFVNKETETCFTLFRKYRVGLIVAIQNLSQLERVRSMAFYKKVVVANTKTHLIFGDTNVEDSQYWSEAFGKEIISTWSSTYSDNMNADTYSESTSMGIAEEYIYRPFMIHYQDFRCLKYKTKNAKGKTVFGDGRTNFLDKKYFEEHPIKFYNFDKYRIYSPYTEYSDTSTPKYDSISVTYSQVEQEQQASEQFTNINGSQEIPPQPEPSITLGENYQASLKDDRITDEEMHALKNLIATINTESKPETDDLPIEIGSSLKETKPEQTIIDAQILDEDKTEAPNVLDKTGKLKIEVKQN